GREIRLGELGEPRQLARPAVQLVLRIEPLERRPERRQKPGIRVAPREIPRARGERALDQTERRLARADRPRAAIRLDEPALLERSVARRDGGGTDLELLCQLADRRQPVSGGEPLVRDCLLDRLRDRGGAGSFELLY